MSNKRTSNWRPGRFEPDPARRVVFHVLMAIEIDGAYANIELPYEIRIARLGKRDAAYATNLCYGTLRMQGRWDAIAAHCIRDGRSMPDLDPDVRVLVRMGVHQLFGFGTQAYAAINETVNLARDTVGTGASGFINAVLHRASERTLDQWREQLAADAGGATNSLAFLSAWYSHPQWIVQAISEALTASGRSSADLVNVLKADNEPPSVALAARDLSVNELTADIERGHMAWKPGLLVDSAVLLHGGDPGRVFAVKDARAGVQDEGSQLVARIFASAPVRGNQDDLWLDMCAGPGGKTATMAALAAQRGAQIHANELHDHRLDMVERAVQPWEDIVAVRLGDGRDIGDEEPEVYDRVLVDAPCTGIGALRRRPEARWAKTAGDAIDLCVLQGELLDSAWKAVRVGGIVTYSTCSPYLRETRTVTQEFLARHPDAKLLDAPAIATKETLMDLTGTDRQLQLWQDLHHSDAMYVAVMRKLDDSIKQTQQ